MNLSASLKLSSARLKAGLHSAEIIPFQGPLKLGDNSEIRKNKSPEEWAQLYRPTVLFSVSLGKGRKEYHLRTGDPNVARHLRRKAKYKERGVRLIWGPCKQWYFKTEYATKANAIRSLSRILRRECIWDPKRFEIKVRPKLQEKGVAS